MRSEARQASESAPLLPAPDLNSSLYMKQLKVRRASRTQLDIRKAVWSNDSQRLAAVKSFV